MDIIELANLNAFYGSKKVLNNINMKINRQKEFQTIPRLYWMERLSNLVKRGRYSTIQETEEPRNI